jgi:PBSX family phage portal protein
MSKNKNRSMVKAEIIEVKKDSSQIPENDINTIEGAIPTPYDINQLADFYEDSTWHYRCVNAKVQTVCGLGWEIKPKEEDRKQDAEYQKLKDFIDRPNRGETFFDLLQKFWIDYEALGNAYFEVVLNNGGELAELYHIPAYTMRKLSSRASNLGDYMQWRPNTTKHIYFEDFNNEKYLKSDINKVAHLFSYFLRSDYYGMPDFLPALGAIKLNDNALVHNLNFFENRAIPAFAIVVEGGSLTPEAKRLVQSFLKSNYKGVANSYRTLYIPTTKGVTVKFEKLSQEIDYSEFAKMRIDNRDEIIAAHGVPPRMITIAQAGQLGGTAEAYYQLKIFKELIVAPRQKRFEHFLNNIFFKGLGIENWEIAFNGIELDNPFNYAQQLAYLSQGNLITANEGRDVLGLPAIEDDAYNELALAKQINKLRIDLEKAL